MTLEERCQDIAELGQLLAHPARVRILCALRERELCVQHLQKILHRPQPYVSQHLQVLREADIVSTRKEGVNVFYTLADPRIRALLDTWFGPPRGQSNGVCCCRGPSEPSI
ncbi:MAG: ArsR/SmtB family transcription factor [Anaerolineae bacterium]